MNEENRDYLLHVNKEQREGILSSARYTLVIAAAGTGKTRVITSRIKHILGQNNNNYNEIIALTFTNKAAREMLHRLDLTGAVYIGTFHSICLRLLRQFGNNQGPQENVIDEDDSKKILESLGYNVDYLYSIKKCQDQGIFPENLPAWDNVKEVYLDYLRELKKRNLLDFGSIIMRTIEMLKDDEIGNRIRTQFKHILVDEYQDTSKSQELLISYLVKDGATLFVVGDPRQSVYEWRGASRENIMSFTDRYENAAVISLQENYRSTQEILNFATALMGPENTKENKIKGQFHGEKVKIYMTQNPEQEGRFIASKIHELMTKGYQYKDMAILTRSNMALRTIEHNLHVASIPYRVFGGIKFFERDEVKTLMCYLRIIYNFKDLVAFDRILQYPKKGVGLKTAQELKQANDQWGFLDNPFDGLEQIKITKKAYENLRELENKIYLWREELKKTNNLTEFVMQLINESGLLEYYEEQKRINNMKQLAEIARSFQHLGDLVNSFFNLEEDDDQRNEISLMTYHMSKGSEFPVVFLPCFNEGYFPHPKSISEGRIAEEMRLAHVIATRPKNLLYICCYANVALSRFLKYSNGLVDIFKVSEQY